MCVFDNWRRFLRHFRFKKGFYGLSDISTVFQEHIDKVLECKTPVWLDDFICVTNGTIDEHEREVREVLTKLQSAGNRASETKTELIKQTEVNLARLPHRSKRGKTNKRQDRGDNKTEGLKEC